MCQYHDLICSKIPAQNVALSKLLFKQVMATHLKKYLKVAAAYFSSAATTHRNN